MTKSIDTAVITLMRIILLICFVVFSTAVYAQTPLPVKKPISSQSFDKIIDAVSQVEKPIPRAPIIRQYVENSSIIMPPPLPEAKKRRLLKIEQARVINGIPVPLQKPFSVAALATQTPEKATAQQNNFDERTASSKVRSHAMANVERTYSRERERLRTTSEKSPFKTAKLPRAGRVAGNDPTIIFFKEQSSELEVGQIGVIKSDILQRLRQSPTRKVAVYGYAERNRDNPDKSQKLSLSRALLISEYLADNRINPNRIEARAMGDDTPISPKNRVDVVLF